MEKKIHQSLQEIQTELKAPKGQYNKFGNYPYRSLEDIVEAVKPLLAKHSLSLLFEDDIVQVGERYYLRATAILTNGDSTITTHAFAREAEEKKGMDSAQITGSVSSYARKYAANALFAIDDTKDSDATNTHEKEKAAPQKKQYAAPVEDINPDDIPF